MIPKKYDIKFSDNEKVAGVDVEVNVWRDFDHADMHGHEFIEINYIHKGEGWYLFNDEMMRCHAGDVFIVEKGDAHMVMSELDDMMTIYNLIFKPSFFDNTLAGCEHFSDVTNSFLLKAFSDVDNQSIRRTHFSEAELPRVSHLFETMLFEYDTHKTGFEELIRAYTLELLVMIFRKNIDFESETRIKKEHSDDFDSVLSYITEHYTENIPLKDLADIMYVSPKYFSKLFKEYIGMTVTDYIQRMRVFLARDLLDNTALSVVKVAEQCGYSDVKFFNDVFYRLVRKKPTEYRKRTVNS